MSADSRPRPRAFPLAGENSPVGEGAALIEAQPDAYALEATDADSPQGDEAEQAIEAAQQSGLLRASLLSWSGLFWGALGGLISIAATLSIGRLIEDLFARSAALGAVGALLAGLAALALATMTAREVFAIYRQKRIARLHIDVAKAHQADNRDEARALVGALSSLYENRPQTASARAHLARLRGEIVDGRDLLDIAERELMRPLDEAARREIASAAKRVSAVVAISPRALIDVIFVAAQALRLMRRIAEIYGGRPGFLGAIKLARSVGTHLAITGSLAIGDSLLQQIVGHGVAAKISARLGEGVLNGLLTARIGLSAMSVCRPMPFAATNPPGVKDVAPFLFGEK